MTISAGFKCQDGVVLCADTQMNAGVSKFSQSKFRMYNKLGCRPAFVYAGDRDFCIMSTQMLAEAMLGAERRKESVIGAIRDKATEIHKAYFDLSTPDRQFDLQVLVTVEQAGKRSLHCVSGPVVSLVDNAECIGSGTSLGYYIVDTMFDRLMTVSQAACMCAYLLFIAKSYASYCGNDSQIMVFKDGGGWYRFPSDPLQSVSIQDMEADFKALQSKLKRVLVGLVDFGQTNKQYETSLQDFIHKAGEIRTKRSDQIERYIQQEIERQENQEEYEVDEQSES